MTPEALTRPDQDPTIPSAYLSVEVWPIDMLVEDPRNYRGHPIEQIRQIAASLRGRGFRKPIVVQKSSGMVIAGHGLLEAAKSIGMTEVSVAPWDCTDQQARSFLIADNELSRLAVDDDEALNGLLVELAAGIGSPEELIDEGIGFDIDELLVRMDEFNRKGDLDTEVPDPDTPDIPDNPITKTGDVWVMGGCRLLCGDSTDPASYNRLLPGGSTADMVFTDPPYGISYSGRGKNTSKTIANDHLSAESGELFDFLSDSLGIIPVKKGGCVYICHADSKRMVFEAVFRDHYTYSATIIWVKRAASMGWQDYRWRHEPIIYGWLEGPKRMRVKDRTESTVWNIDRDPSASYQHPTQKPIALARRAILNSSRRGDVVLDPFLGAGATLLASEQVGRRGYGIELEPGYCDVIVQRWESMTGEKAVLEVRPATTKRKKKKPKETSENETSDE